MAEATMGEVVQRVRAENCRALLELRAFWYALEDVVKNVEQFAIASEEVHHRALRDLGAPLGDRTERLSTHATQIVLTFRALRVALLSWNVAGASESALHRTAMRDVVQRLRTAGSEAMGELRTFDSSFDQLLHSFAALALTSGEIHVAAQNIGAPDTIEGYRRVRAMRKHADELSTRSTQVLLATRALRAEVVRWNIMGTSGGSNEPNDDGSSCRSTLPDLEKSPIPGDIP